MRNRTLQPAIFKSLLHSQPARLLLQIFAITLAWTLLGTPTYASAIYYVSYIGSSAVTGGGGTSGSSTVSQTAGALTPAPLNAASFFVQNFAAPNDLGVYGYVASAAGPGGDSSVYLDVLAELQDSLTLANSPTNGFLAITVDIDGSNAVSTQGTGSAQWSIQLFASGGAAPSSCIGAYSQSPTASCGALVAGANLLLEPYTLQTNGTIPFTLSFEADDLCETDSSSASLGGTCQADTDYIDTAQVASIVVEDANGNPVSGATATSINGVDYTSTPTSPTSIIPEPSSLLLLSTGLATLLLHQLRQPPPNR